MANQMMVERLSELAIAADNLWAGVLAIDRELTKSSCDGYQNAIGDILDAKSLARQLYMELEKARADMEKGDG